MTGKSKARKAPFSMPLLDDVLTPEEQKLFNEQLNECKKRNYDSDTLTKRAEEIRNQILAARKDSIPPAVQRYPRPPRMLVLPGLVPVIREPHISPLSNWLAKTSIFAPRRSGPRKDTGTKWIELASPRGVTIYYNGPELDMADHTLYLNLIKLAEGRAPNDLIYINRANLLKKCGYAKIGKSAYDWLGSAFDRLMQARIKIVVDNAILKDGDTGIFDQDVSAIEIIKGQKVQKLNLTLQIMGELAETPETGDYYFTLPPTSLALFASQLYGYNDLVKRNQIQKGNRGDLAAWLQSYICADHAGDHHPILVETLWRHSASNSRINDFTARLKIALDTCKASGVILSWEMFQNEKKQKLITWSR